LPGLPFLGGAVRRPYGCQRQQPFGDGVVARLDSLNTRHSSEIVPAFGRLTGVKAGAFDFIEKPIDENRLLASIHAAMEKVPHSFEAADVVRHL
jgi:FixJ family two-component response regulator